MSKKLLRHLLLTALILIVWNVAYFSIYYNLEPGLEFGKSLMIDIVAIIGDLAPNSLILFIALIERPK